MGCRARWISPRGEYHQRAAVSTEHAPATPTHQTTYHLLPPMGERGNSTTIPQLTLQLLHMGNSCLTAASVDFSRKIVYNRSILAAVLKFKELE